MRRWAAERLEQGSFRGPVGRALARPWQRLAEPVRPVVLPAGIRVIGVGGARLGGDGKTPVTLELARSLRRAGQRVVVVARRYPGSLPRPLRVSRTDCAAAVGDEPLLLARALDGSDVPVVACSSYEQGLAYAATLGTTVVVDGLLQAAPRRLARALLVVGRGPLARYCPPAGDLRAAWPRLLAGADRVLLESGAEPPPCTGARPPPILRFESAIGDLLAPNGERSPLSRLKGRRFGLVLALARPERVIDALAKLGLRPWAVDCYGDHHTLGRAALRAEHSGVELWVTSSKCRVKLGLCYRDRPLWTLEHRINLPPSLIESLAPSSGLHSETPW